jgi:hypothetical protein
MQMRNPARFAPILFGALHSAIMVAPVSAVVVAITQGLHLGFAAQWLKSCATTWPAAFPTRSQCRNVVSKNLKTSAFMRA